MLENRLALFRRGSHFWFALQISVRQVSSGIPLSYEGLECASETWTRGLPFGIPRDLLV